METGDPRGTATLAALADGTTSPYVTVGGGIIGGGFHQAMSAATRWFLAELEHRLPLLRPDPDAALPECRFRLVFVLVAVSLRS